MCHDRDVSSDGGHRGGKFGGLKKTKRGIRFRKIEPLAEDCSDHSIEKIVNGDGDGDGLNGKLDTENYHLEFGSRLNNAVPVSANCVEVVGIAGIGLSDDGSHFEGPRIHLIGREMVGERKPGLELAIQRELACRKKVPNPKNEVVKTLSRSPSFTDWTDAQGCHALHHNTTSPEVQSSIELPRLTYPSPRLQNPMEQSLIKIEPYSDEISNPINLTSAHKDWIGPSYKPFDKKQTHSSSELPPDSVPFSRQIPAEKTQPPKLDSIPKTNTMTHQRPKYFPRPNIPTKTRSSLKRKAIIDVQELPSPQASSRNNNIRTMVKYSENINLFCEVCQVSCSGGKAMQDHLKGRPHKAKMVYMQLMKKSNCTVKQPRCNVCKIFCSDRSLMELHLKGQKHKAKLNELEESRRNGTGGIVVKKKPVFCELCHVSCMNEDLFKMHLKGRQHVTRLEMKRRRMI